MIVHLPGHPYALFREGVIVDIILTDHDESVMPIILDAHSADSFVSCCEVGTGAVIGGTVLGGRFQPPKPYPHWVWDNAAWEWIPPIAKPAASSDPDKFWYWDPITDTWLEDSHSNPSVGLAPEDPRRNNE